MQQTEDDSTAIVGLLVKSKKTKQRKHKSSKRRERKQAVAEVDLKLKGDGKGTLTLNDNSMDGILKSVTANGCQKSLVLSVDMKAGNINTGEEYYSAQQVKQDTFFDTNSEDELKIHKAESAPQIRSVSRDSIDQVPAAVFSLTQNLSEEILQQTSLDKPETGEDSIPLTPIKKKAKSKFIRPRPHRSISFPAQTQNLRSGKDSMGSSKWTSVKHALQITNNLAKQHKSRQDSFMEKFNTNRRVNEFANHVTEESCDQKTEGDSYVEVRGKRFSQQWRQRYCNVMVFHPDGNFIFYWLLLLSVTVEYNLWILILRQAFPLIQEHLSSLWYVLDAIADLTYILDIVVQFRTGYLEDGLLVTKQKKLIGHYVKSKYFAIDVASLIPLDFFQFTFGVQPLLRFPRFVKIYRLIQFFYLAENQTTYPNVLRVCNLTHILLLLCHWFAAFYYMISKSEGLPGTWTVTTTNETVFSQTTRIYLKSLYWSTLTLTTIGDLPTPESNWQHSWTHEWYMFQILSYLIGVFVFATIVGQVGNSINNYNATRHEYEQLLDGAKLYMRKHEVPKEMQVRVQRWCDYAWTRGRMQGALDINSLKMLPDRLKTELALHVHLDILKQVTIFEDCEPEFLHDLVLKMHTYIFTPGDMVVRKGEIAREMFIIADGHVDVIGEKGKIIARLSAGNFFGEIGILNLDGGINRRTADVKSVGYSELFVLKREDIVRAIKYYPSAKASLMKHARERLAEMREQNTANTVTTLNQNEPPPEIQTIFASEDESSEPFHSNHVSTAGGLSSNLRRSRHSSTYSIKSIEQDQDTMRIKENELIAKLTEDLEKKNRDILRLTKELHTVKRRDDCP